MSLTTTDDVKEQIKIVGNDDDALLDRLVLVADSMIENALGRKVKTDTYTLFVDGSGKRILWLPQGPLTSITSVSDVTYNPVTGTPTPTAIDVGQYFAGGLEADGHIGLSWIEGYAFSWIRGQRNYKVIVDAGFTTVPNDITQLAIDVVAWHFNQRKAGGLSSRDIGAGAVIYRDIDALREYIQMIVRPYGAS
jgi:hypothetical protein